MAYIKTDRVTVVYPIYNSRSQSLRHALIEVGTGGIVARGARNITTVTALDGVSLSLKDGDRVGLTGHNGSGKSTLLRLLAGVYAPTSGEIEMSGSISTIFQLGTGLDPELTGYENIERMGMFLGLRKAEARRFIPDIEEFTELGQFLSVPVRTYSAGMMTRLTFAVATAVKPSILLIDEVFSAGDASFQAKARKRMAEMIDSVKILVFASHSKELLDLYCNQIIRLEHGKVVDVHKTGPAKFGTDVGTPLPIGVNGAPATRVAAAGPEKIRE